MEGNQVAQPAGNSASSPEVVQEVVQEAQQKSTQETTSVVQPEIKLTIESADGIKTVKNTEGNSIFQVSDSFTDEQINEVFTLCDGFFKEGARFGVTRLQFDAQRLLGIAPKAAAPAAPAAPAEAPVEAPKE